MNNDNKITLINDIIHMLIKKKRKKIQAKAWNLFKKILKWEMYLLQELQ